MLASRDHMLAQLDALRNIEGLLAALCDIDRLMREFMARVSTTGSPTDIHPDGNHNWRRIDFADGAV